MKICMLIRSMPAHGVGGMEDHAISLSRALIQRGHSVDIITTRHPNGIDHEDIDGVRIHYLEHTWPRRYFGGWWNESVRKVLNLHKNLEFDVLHSQSAGAFAVIKRGINYNLGLPIVVSLHGTAVNEMRSKLNIGLPLTQPLVALRNIASFLKYVDMFYRIERFYIPRADAVIATSNEQLSMIQKYYRVEKERIHLVYNGIDVDHFSPKLTSIESSEKESNLLILAVARLVEDKGIENIIKAMPLIKKKVPGARLKIVGDGRQRQYLEGLVDHFGLSSSVSFTGYVAYAQLPDHYRNCKVFVNPTIRSNGYDLTILQAMACSCPVVLSNIGSIPTVAKNEFNSLLIDPGDVDAMANKIVLLLTDEPLAKRLGNSARRTVEKEFSLESMAFGTESVYAVAISKRR